MDLDQKKECVLEQEAAFAHAIGSAVLDKPKVSFWMILLPILFVYFAFRMQKFKKSSVRFHEDFMKTRKRTLDLVCEAEEAGRRPDINVIVRQSSISEEARPAYEAWVRCLTEYYTDLLSGSGDSFDSLARSAFRNRTQFLLVLNRLSTTEKTLYAALKGQFSATEGAVEIIAAIESHSQRLRRDLAAQIFP